MIPSINQTPYRVKFVVAHERGETPETVMNLFLNISLNVHQAR